MALPNCPICDQENVPHQIEIDMRAIINCPVCGRYAMQRLIAKYGLSAEYIADHERHLLSSYLRNRSEHLPIEFLDGERIQELAESLPRFTVPEKQDIFLKHLESRTQVPGDIVVFLAFVDYPLIWAASEAEVEHHIAGLVERDFIGYDAGDITIKFKGWDYLTQLRRNRATSAEAFVAMWFDNSMNDAWENGIRPAITDAGYRPRRVCCEFLLCRINPRKIQVLSCRY